MEAAGLIEKVEQPRQLRFNFEDVNRLPPPIIAFDNVAFSYSGKKEDYLYRNLSFGIECVRFHWLFESSARPTPQHFNQHGLSNRYFGCQRDGQVDAITPDNGGFATNGRHN